ncbi:hypothetical protein GSS88_02680 [Corynebacterium sp. 3HC-13]|uniref:LGFP repeat-containing protein n=1 Tax=Corynebacterium poyangense TaxID=2684405 RepID=UPI001CCBCE3C|nr:hypothetical protein [Corynebacterium poyangense]MBZ8176704.1 hypothetical protein [Corynebacterium poyangense]
MHWRRTIFTLAISITLGVCADQSAVAAPSLTRDTDRQNNTSSQVEAFLGTEDSPTVDSESDSMSLSQPITPSYITNAVNEATYTDDPVSFGEVGGLTQEEVEAAQQIARETLADGNPKQTVSPGLMWSDRIGLPPGADKTTADQAEIEFARDKAERDAVEQARREGRLVGTDRSENCVSVPFNPHQVCGAIGERYQQLGGVTSWLLWPVSGEIMNPDGVGYRQEFKNGYIYWHPSTGAHAIAINNYRVWAKNGFETGWLGYPVGGEVPVKGSSPLEGELNGWVQQFQGGRLYRTPVTQGSRVAAITGEILKRWEAIGGPSSVLGFPVSDETAAPDNRGRFNVFQFGSLWWHPETGAWEVPQSVDTLWNLADGVTGPYGYPIGETKVNEYHIPYETPFQHDTLNIWTELDKDEWVQTPDGKTVSKLLLQIMGGNQASSRQGRAIGDEFTDPATGEKLKIVKEGKNSYGEDEIRLSNGKGSHVSTCPWSYHSLDSNPFVKVPTDYRYIACHMPRRYTPQNSPALKNYYINDEKLSLHDFCSISPDWWAAQTEEANPVSGNSPVADLRGPCARHDQCYEKMLKPGGVRSFEMRHECDKRLRADIFETSKPMGFEAANRVSTLYYLTVFHVQGTKPGSPRWP